MFYASKNMKVLLLKLTQMLFLSVMNSIAKIEYGHGISCKKCNVDPSYSLIFL